MSSDDTDDTHFKITKVFDLLENSETLVTILKTILIKNDYYNKQRWDLMVTLGNVACDWGIKSPLIIPNSINLQTPEGKYSRIWG